MPLPEILPLYWPYDFNALSPLEKFIVDVPFVGKRVKSEKHLIKQMISRPDIEAAYLWAREGGIPAYCSELFRIFKESCYWPSSTFIPDDPCEVILYGLTGGSSASLSEIESIIDIENAIIPGNIQLDIEKISDMSLRKLVQSLTEARASVEYIIDPDDIIEKIFNI